MSNPSPARKRPQNIGSSLLYSQENEALFRLLGAKNYTLATGVVQLLAADGPSRRDWNKKLVGVVCFIKDYGEKTYFLRLYDISKSACVWEQAFYDGFNVKQKTDFHTPHLVTFEGDSCVYGLNFSSVDEASTFATQVNKHYEQELKQKNRISTPNNPPNPSLYSTNNTTSQNIVAPTPTMNFGNNVGGGKGKKNKKNKPLTKDQIGLPTNFQHKVHVGWNPGEGFQTQTNAVSGEDLDPNIRLLLDKIGVTDQQKLSKKDRKMIYDVIDQYGGIEAVKHELSQPPPPPSRSPPVPPAPYSTGSHQAPRNGPSQQKTRELPPPPPPSVAANAANARPLPSGPVGVGRPAPPPAPPVGGGKSVAPPPPPPPPPPMQTHSANAPPPPPPPPPALNNTTGGAGAAGGRPNLLSEIEHGVVLKSVSSTETMKGSRSSDSRDAMLKDIKEGISLRPVDPQERQRVTPPEEMGGIAGALARALQDRRFKITDDTDSEDDDDNEEEDEWDD